MGDQLIDDLVKRTINPCKTALKAAGLSKSDIDEIILVGGSTRIPAVQDAVEKFFGKKPSKGVDPDEVVAVGAAIQGGVFTGDVKDVLLLDVTPLSLGIETMGNVMAKLIEANTTIPTKKSQVFSIAADNQPAVDIRIAQGERPMYPDNKEIGRFQLADIPPAPRGTPQIEVTFDIDANGILNVSAKDKATGKEQSVVIRSSGGLSEDEINKMVQDAEENAAADAERKKLAEAKNEADALVYTSKKSLEEHGDKLDAETKSEVEAKIAALEGLGDDASADDLRAKIDELQAVAQKIASRSTRRPSRRSRRARRPRTRSSPRRRRRSPRRRTRRRRTRSCWLTT